MGRQRPEYQFIWALYILRFPECLEAQFWYALNLRKIIHCTLGRKPYWKGRWSEFSEGIDPGMQGIRLQTIKTIANQTSCPNICVCFQWMKKMRKWQCWTQISWFRSKQCYNYDFKHLVFGCCFLIPATTGLRK